MESSPASNLFNLTSHLYASNSDDESTVVTTLYCAETVTGTVKVSQAISTVGPVFQPVPPAKWITDAFIF
jgi:hypothetical protein